jgi:hypothetical protein
MVLLYKVGLPHYESGWPHAVYQFIKKSHRVNSA